MSCPIVSDMPVFSWGSVLHMLDCAATYGRLNPLLGSSQVRMQSYAFLFFNHFNRVRQLFLILRNLQIFFTSSLGVTCHITCYLLNIIGQ